MQGKFLQANKIGKVDVQAATKIERSVKQKIEH